MNHTSRTAIALSAALLAAFLLAVSANAATYTVYSCKGPADEALPNEAWLQAVTHTEQAASFAFGLGCGDASVTANPHSAYAFGDGAGLAFDAPPGTTIESYSVVRSASVTFPAGEAHPALSAGLRGASGLYTGECDAVTSDCDTGSGEVSASGLTASNLRVGVECADEATGCAADVFTGLKATLHSAQVVLADNNAPTILSATGSLPGTSGYAGMRTLDVTATDVGGGVSSILFALDGGKPEVHNTGGSCSEPFTRRAPCPPGTATSFAVDLASLSAGLHSAVVTVVDAAGNSSSAGPVTFQVTSPPTGPVPSNGQPSVEQPLVGTDTPVIRTSSSKNVTVQGTLKAGDGTPIGGAVLEVTALDLGIYDAKAKSLGTITTAPNGSFSIIVKPIGARRISVLFKPYPSSIGTAVASTIVRENLKLKAKRSKSRVKAGGRFSISGQLQGAGAASSGAPVEIDVNIGGKWRAVGVVKANAKGRFKWKYRFVRVTRPTKFRFRAVVRGNKAWPWPTKASSQVKVLVR